MTKETKTILVKKKWKSHLGPHSPSLSVIISRHGWFMRLKRLRSCNQRVLSCSMPAERVWECEGGVCFQPCRPNTGHPNLQPWWGERMSKHSDYQSSSIKALYPSLNQRSDWRALACQRFSLIAIVEWSEPCVAWLQLHIWNVWPKGHLGNYWLWICDSS